MVSKFADPPPRWMDRRTLVEGMTPEEAKAHWDGLRYAQKKEAHRAAKSRLARREVIHKAVADGTATRYQRLRANTNDDWMRKTREEYQRDSARRAFDEISMDRRVFKQHHMPGCSVAGCPLGHNYRLAACGCCLELDPTKGYKPPPLACHIECDHIQPEETRADGTLNPMRKMGNVSHLQGEARYNEWLKCSVVCLWHHFEHTWRQNISWRSIHLMPDGVQKDFATAKVERGCEHPMHNRWSFARLVSTNTLDIPLHGFLHVVSRSNSRGTAASYRLSNAKGRSRSLLALMHKSDAIVHCAFCSALLRLCERAKDGTALHTKLEHARLMEDPLGREFDAQFEETQKQE